MKLVLEFAVREIKNNIHFVLKLCLESIDKKSLKIREKAEVNYIDYSKMLVKAKIYSFTESVFLKYDTTIDMSFRLHNGTYFVKNIGLWEDCTVKMSVLKI